MRGTFKPGADTEPWATGTLVPRRAEGSSQEQGPARAQAGPLFAEWSHLGEVEARESWARPLSPREEGTMAPGPKCVRSAMSILSDTQFM